MLRVQLPPQLFGYVPNGGCLRVTHPSTGSTAPMTERGLLLHLLLVTLWQQRAGAHYRSMLEPLGHP